MFDSAIPLLSPASAPWPSWIVLSATVAALAVAVWELWRTRALGHCGRRVGPEGQAVRPVMGPGAGP